MTAATDKDKKTNTMEDNEDVNKHGKFNKVMFKNGGKKSVKVPAKPFMIKMRAEFRTPKSARAQTTFHVNSALKGLNSAIFAIEQGIHIIREDGKDCFDNNSNFPTNEEVKRYYQVEHGNKAHGQNLITVIFTVIGNVNLKTIKQSTGFVNYLQENNIWLKEHHFETGCVTRIGFMAMSSTGFNFFEDYKIRLRNMIEAHLLELDNNDDSIDEDLRKFAASGKAIPKFDVVVNKVSFRKPDPAKAMGQQRNSTTTTKKAPTLETTAYEIQCEVVNSNELRMILLVLTNVDKWLVGRFIPYSWARQQPAAFHQSIVQHISFLNTAAKFPIFNANPRIMNGTVQVDQKCTMDEDLDDDEDNDSLTNGSIRSLMTDVATNEMTVVEYVCSMAGAMKNDPNQTPLTAFLRNRKDQQVGHRWTILCPNSPSTDCRS